jgi:thiosulfate reductase cytochrome b subunit
MYMEAADMDRRQQGRRTQPLLIRLAHWLNVPLLVLMAGSGLQILSAYPALGPRGALYAWYPWQGVPPPHWLCFGGWLAGGRHWHFALGWFLVGNGIVYLSYIFAQGEWQRRLFLPHRDARNAVLMLVYYLRLRKEPPPTDFYNGLQRQAYTAVLLIALIEVLSGLAIYKPVQLWWLGSLFGGYDGARAVHFLGLCSFGLFTLVHLVMVMLHPRAIVEMITGGHRG